MAYWDRYYKDKPEYFDLPLYYINLDRSVERRQQLEQQLERYKIKATRISGTDGRTFNTEFINTLTQPPKGVANNELEHACTVSHLKTIQKFLQDDYNYAMIVEDDVDLSLHRLWKESLGNSLLKLPSDWDIVLLYDSQASINNSNAKNNKFVKGKNWGTVAYAISRKGAENILKSVPHINNRWDFTKMPVVAADVILYGNSNNVYVLNRLAPLCQDPSTIHPNHDHVHLDIRNNIINCLLYRNKNYYA
jgi:GR25 family glycosyltransferase involved in LPS biosynthesis